MRKMTKSEQRVIERQARALEKVAEQLDKLVTVMVLAGGSVGTQETLREVMRAVEIEADRLGMLVAVQA